MQAAYYSKEKRIQRERERERERERCIGIKHKDDKKKSTCLYACCVGSMPVVLVVSHCFSCSPSSSSSSSSSSFSRLPSSSRSAFFFLLSVFSSRCAGVEHEGHGDARVRVLVLFTRLEVLGDAGRQPRLDAVVLGLGKVARRHGHCARVCPARHPGLPSHLQPTG